MQTIKINSVQTGMRLVAFWVDDEFPAGEYRLVPVGEAGDKDARIAELEKQLAERSPGVMPECVEKLLNQFIAHGQALKDAVAAVEAYYAPPEGHEWQPVDADHPITAEDVGRRVCRLNETVSVFGASSGWSTTSEVYILRPIDSPFVFDGTLGWYEFASTFGTGRMEVVRRSDGSLAGLHEVGRVGVNADGTFDGGRITGRVE